MTTLNHTGSKRLPRTMLLLGALLATAVAQGQTGGRDRLIQVAQILRSLDEGRSVQGIAGDQKTIKCGLPISLAVIDRWKEFTESQRRQLASLLSPPITHTSRFIGHFQIFYDTTGSNAPALLDAGGTPIPNTVENYVDSVGKCFNDAWAFEIDTLGYDAPPFLPGETHYDVYIQQLPRLYGETQPVNQTNSANPPLWDSYIRIDNDYGGFFSEGIAGLKVTSAHEFHHAIQIGRYGYWTSDVFFLELTSTWMEDVVYADVNDYYQYLSNSPGQTSQFSYPWLRFDLADGSIEYSRAIWGKFIEKRFSRELMRTTWVYVRQYPALTALDKALNDIGSSFRQAFLQWALWNANTGPAGDTTTYYAEGRHYPSMRLKPMIQFISGRRVILDTIQTLSSVYRRIDVNGAQMLTIVSNLDVAVTEQGQTFSYVIADHGDESYRRLSNGLYARLEVSNPAHWAVQESVPEVVADVVVFPNPYIVGGSSSLKFHLPLVSSLTATLTILSSSMDRVFSSSVPVVEERPSEPHLRWDGHDTDGLLVSSGIYFFFITVDDKEYIGKFALIRE